MQEQFDKQFANKIRSTFENYDEPFNNDAWELMKQKLADKKKKTLFLFSNFSKVASILLILGLGIFTVYETNKYFFEKKQIVFNKKEKENIDLAENKTKELLIPTENNEKQIINTKLKITTVKNTGSNKKTNFNKTYKDNSNKRNSNIVLLNKKKSNQNQKNEVNDILNKNNKSNSDTLINKELQKENKKIYASNDKTLKSDSLNKQIKDKITDKKPILMPDDDDFFITKKSAKKFNYSVAFSSHYSSSDMGTADKINVGGGFQTAYIISDNFSINSGLLIANHNMNSKESIQKDKEVYKSSNKTLIKTSETNIKFTGVDIPLNIQYNLNNLYVSTGISSIFYLKESYSINYYSENTTEIFNYETKSYNKVYYYDTENETINKKAFNTFDFAKLFNISLGYKIPLKKGSLIVEPYAKLPIGKLTSYNILYGYGGLGLKYGF